LDIGRQSSIRSAVFGGFLMTFPENCAVACEDIPYGAIVTRVQISHAKDKKRKRAIKAI
jgi:hypothetical protein